MKLDHYIKPVIKILEADTPEEMETILHELVSQEDVHKVLSIKVIIHNNPNFAPVVSHVMYIPYVDNFNQAL